MPKDIIYSYPDEKKELCRRIEKHYRLFNRGLIKDIQKIFENVEQNGDKTILDLTYQFDKVKLNTLEVSQKYIDASIDGLSRELRDAINLAIKHIKEVNEALVPVRFWEKEIRKGTVIGEMASPLEKVGLWIPARKGPLVSTALMLTVAARVAGVKDITVGMSPRADGLGDPATIAAAGLAGADRFVVGNGVGIIAGFSIGTASIPETDGIFGPGPNAIAAAMSVAFSYGKRTVVGIGPTEGAIIADDSADAETIACDMVSESEHGPDSSFLFVTDSNKLANAVKGELYRLIEETPEPRKANLKSVFGGKGFGAIVTVESIEDACRVVNEYAPEHLLINCNESNAETALREIRNTGEILLGKNTPFSAANYLIGITAVLPTNGFAKRFSGITCRDMIKYSSFGRLDKEAIQALYPHIKTIGEYEGLPCHVNAARIQAGG